MHWRLLRACQHAQVEDDWSTEKGLRERALHRLFLTVGKKYDGHSRHLPRPTPLASGPEFIFTYTVVRQQYHTTTTTTSLRSLWRRRCCAVVALFQTTRPVAGGPSIFAPVWTVQSLSILDGFLLPCALLAIVHLALAIEYNIIDKCLTFFFKRHTLPGLDRNSKSSCLVLHLFLIRIVVAPSSTAQPI